MSLYRNINITTSLQTFIMLLTIISFGGVLFVFHQIIIDILLTLSILVVILLNRYKLSVHLLYSCFVFIVFCIIHSFIVQLVITSYLSLIYRFVIAVLTITAFNRNYDTLIYFLIKALKIFCVLSIINFILIHILPYGAFFPTVAESGFFTRTLGYIFNHSAIAITDPINIMRNCGAFWEPGILQILMNILIYYILFEQNKSIKKAWMPILVVITTASTTGYIILGILLLMKYRKMITFSLNGFSIILLGLLVMLTVGYTTLNKFNNADKSLEESSSLLRMYDLLMTAKIAVDHWPTGVGYSPDRITNLQNSNSISLNGEMISAERGTTNGVLQIFAYFGLIVAPIYFIFVWRQKIFSKRGLFFIVWILALSSEPLIFASLSWLIFVSGIENSGFRQKQLLENN